MLWDGPRVSFSPPLRPGKDQILTLPIAAPAKLGRYRIELDLVLETVTWFKDAGSPTVSLALVVRDLAVEVGEPLVSVIIPAFNQAEFLAEAVESVRGQTYSNWECLIIDDGLDRSDIGGCVSPCRPGSTGSLPPPGK